MGQNIVRLVGEVLAASFQSEAAEKFADRVVNYSVGYHYKSDEVKSVVVNGMTVAVLSEIHEWGSSGGGMEVSMLFSIFNEERQQSSSLFIIGVRSRWDEAEDMPRLWFREIESAAARDDEFEIVVVALRPFTHKRTIRIKRGKSYLQSLDLISIVGSEGNVPYHDVFPQEV